MTSHQPPKLCYHKGRSLWYVWCGPTKRRIYLGKDRAKAELAVLRIALDRAEMDQPTALPLRRPLVAGPVPNVGEVLLVYQRHAAAYYERQAQRDRVSIACKAVNDLFASTPAHLFGPQNLKHVQAELLKRTVARGGRRIPISRAYVNGLIASIKIAWKWLASEDQVPAERSLALSTVGAVRKGKGGRETLRITPPEEWAVAAVVAEVRPTIAAMVAFQRWTGCRPQDVCNLCRADVSCAIDERVTIHGTARAITARVVGGQLVRMYCPRAHKMLSRGKPKVVAVGPRAWAAVEPFLTREPDEPIFQPAILRAELAGINPLPVLHVAGSQARRRPGKRFVENAYAKTLAGEIDRLNAARSSKGLPPIPHFRPNQLRHKVATDVGEAHGPIVAAAMLGHGGLATIDVYLEQAVGRAAEVVAKAG